MYRYVRYSNGGTTILIARISANGSKHFPPPMSRIR